MGTRRRDFLRNAATVAGAAVAGPLLASSAQADPGHRGPHSVGIDHVGITVPDIDEAVTWFREVMGAAAPLTFGPFGDPQGTLMTDLLGVDPRAVIQQITSLRIGRSANIELFQYTAPDQHTTHPRNSDWSGHHVAFYVTDIDAAVAYMQSRGAQKFLGPFAVTDGPAAGQSINYFRTPFGTYIELISYPNGMAYEQTAPVPLWSPTFNGQRSTMTSVPGLLGIDHIGITVPDVVTATTWLDRNLGGLNPLTFGPFSDPTGDLMQQLVDVDPRAVIDQIRMVRLGDGPSVELFQYEAPDQDRTFRRNSDIGGHHIALYVDSIDAAVRHLQDEVGTKRLGPFAVTDGPAAGQSINYFGTPFGTDIELISYPHGMAYERTASTLLWDPRDNRRRRSGHH